MISILIPVYNRDVNELVTGLSRQLQLFKNFIADITVMDDGSEPSYQEINRRLAHLPFVSYMQSPANTGRIRARQKLAEAARYEWLLFLDCDSTLVSLDFLTGYCNYTGNSNQVTVGGRVYTKEKPANQNLVLHWKYGSQRELTIFNKQGHINRFMSNNFLISRTVFNKLDFSGGWDSYGYEDTWMAIQFEELKVPVVFIDNPVLHDGLETSSVFIEKSKEALVNLERLSKLVTPGILGEHVRLYKYFYKLKSLRVLWMVWVLYVFSGKLIKRNLFSSNPSLYMYDLYRLYIFISKPQVYGNEISNQPGGL